MSDLARRAVACPRWRWMPGMLDAHGHRILTVDSCATPLAWAVERYGDPRIIHYQPFMGDLWTRCAPVLDDAATRGCLLALVREIHASLQSTEYVGDSDPVNPWRWGAYRGASEEAALVAALERAPCSGS